MTFQKVFIWYNFFFLYSWT